MLAVIRFIVLILYFIGINALLFIFYLTRPFHRNNVFIAGQVYSTMARIVGLRLDLRLPDNLNDNESYIFLANHQNNLDLITICKAAQPGVVTVGKKSLKWVPIFGLIYWLSGNIMIDRKNSDSANDTLLETAAKMNKRHLSVWFFPEGTRSRGKGLLPFKTGAFRLAQMTKKKIVLVCASNLHNKVKMNRWNNGKVIIEVMQPEDFPKDLSVKQLSALYHQKLKTKYTQLNDEIADSSLSTLS